MLPIPTNYIKKIESISYNFIWGTREKIKRAVLISDYCKGGIKMIDIESFFLSLKASWAAKIISSKDPWSNIAKYQMSKLAPLNVIMNMSFQEIKHMTPITILPKFYQEIILAISKSKICNQIKNKTELFHQQIWGNRMIKFENKCLYSKEMIDSNIIYIKDIIQDNGIINPNVYHRLKCKANYFRDISLILKALKSYKHILASEHIEITINTNTFPSNKSKPYYNALILQKELSPKSISIWQQEIDNFQINNFYHRKLRFMHIAKVKEFLFKTIHKICVCRDLLFKWKISDKRDCLYCQNPCQTFKHLVWECNSVYNFWKFIENKLSITLSYNILIVGTSDIPQNNTISILMFLIYKKFIKENEDKTNQNLMLYLRNEISHCSKLFGEAIKQTDCIYLHEVLDIMNKEI